MDFVADLEPRPNLALEVTGAHEILERVLRVTVFVPSREKFGLPELAQSILIGVRAFFF